MKAASFAPMTIARSLVRSGLFRSQSMERLGVAPEFVAELLAEYPAGSVVEFGSGWVAVRHDSTVAMNAMLRIAGALDISPVPLRDVGAAIVKMVEWGCFTVGGKRDGDLGKVVRELYDDHPCRESLSALCAFIDVPVSTDGKADFSRSSRLIHPVNAVEAELLELLSFRPGNSAAASVLARRLVKRPSRTQVDYKIVPSIPFVLREDKGPVRLLGGSVDEVTLVKAAGDTFVGMRRSSDGNAVVMEYKVNEEAVEGNSFNVTPECKSMAHGEFLEVTTGKAIRFNRDGKDARKFVGIGVVIRKLYPDYESSETVYVMLDRARMLARVVVGMRFDKEFETAANLHLENGIEAPASAVPLAA